MTLLGSLTATRAAHAQGPGHRLDVFVVAHADDWQLFMGDVLVDALRHGRPVVAIITSAGDAARGSEFWHTREAGALASMQAAQGLAGGPLSAPLCTSWRLPARPLRSPRRGTEPGVRTVRVCRGDGTSTAFLRLPDGRPDSSGFAVHGYRSLQKLAQTSLGPLAALDGTAAYTSVTDLAETVAALVRGHERPGMAVHVHSHDPEVLTNPLDHADHRVTGRIALEAARDLHASATLYAGYSNVRRADNLLPEAAAWKMYCFVQYDRAMMTRHGNWSAYAENAWGHAQYLFRTYARPAGSTGLLRHSWP